MIVKKIISHCIAQNGTHVNSIDLISVFAIKQNGELNFLASVTPVINRNIKLLIHSETVNQNNANL